MQQFKNILCIINKNMDNSLLLSQATELANNNQASLTVIEVIDQLPPNMLFKDQKTSINDLKLKLISECEQRLENLIKPISKHIEIHIRVLYGIAFIEIIREVLRNNRDLIIKTADNNGLIDRLFGSEDMHLLRKCPCPVWLVKESSSDHLERILASVDVDDNYPLEEIETRNSLNVQIIEIASSLALDKQAELHVLNVWGALAENFVRSDQLTQPDEDVDHYIDVVRQKHQNNLSLLMTKIKKISGKSIKATTELVKGYPRKDVPLYAKNIKADLLIMGTVSRTGISGFFMGNTAETILNQLDCSVLTIKPPGFISPVTLD